METNLKRHGVWFVGKLGVSVITATLNKIPIAVKIVAPAVQATFVCVTWRDAYTTETQSYAFIPPWTVQGSNVSLFPRIECNRHAKPLNVQIMSVVDRGTCSTQHGTLWGRPWLKIVAIIASRCAATRYPWLTNNTDETERFVSNDAVVFPVISLFNEFGCVLPAANVNTDGTHTCAHCGTKHKTFSHYIAMCAPDAVI